MDRFGINKLAELPLTGAVCWATDEKAFPTGLLRQWFYRNMQTDWGLSILHGGGSYSEGSLGENATFEVALVRWNGLNEFEVVQDDAITGDDVMAYQTLAEIQALLDVISLRLGLD